VVEDDAPLAQLLRQQLQAKSHDVSVAHDGEEARQAIAEGRFDLVILDLNLPKLDGIALLQQIRPTQPRLPVLVLTARHKVEDRAFSLDAGADDCMIKPFSFIELHARVRALLRRNTEPISRVSQVGDLMLDREEHRVERNGRRIDLTTREYDLLEFLMRNAGRPVSRANLMEQVWNMPFDPSTNLVDVYASAEMDKKKVVELSAAIQGAFQQMGMFSKASSADNSNKDAKVGALCAAPAPTTKREVNASGSADAYALQRELESILGTEIKQHEIEMRVTPEWLVLSLREVGFFNSGQARLMPAAIPKLARIAQVLNAHGFDIRVEGHTDDVPIHTATYQSNWELSTARATEVVALLVEDYHLDPLKIAAAGYGPYRPVAANDTAQGRGINRRVDLVITSQPITETVASRPSQSLQSEIGRSAARQGAANILPTYH
jgi:chemotaxis protein MotB